jgi:hypothetical protein
MTLDNPTWSADHIHGERSRARLRRRYQHD